MIAMSKGMICGLFARQRTGLAVFRFHLPDLGEKIKEGQVKKLFVGQGDKVNEFQTLAEISSDKQLSEITSPYAGVIKKVFYRVDQTCQVGDPFIQIETNDQNPAQQSKTVHPTPSTPPHTHPEHATRSDGEILASATVKMLSRQHKIDLHQVKGTGRKGRILKEDIIYFVENRSNEKNTTKNIQPKQSPLHPQRTISKDQITKNMMNQHQKQIQHIVTYSNTIPHLYYQQTFDVTQIQQLISQLKEPKISLMSILIKTFCLALREYPRMNSTYSLQDPFTYKIHPQYHILLPAFSDKGTIFNVLNNAESLNIKQISTALTHPTPQSLSSATICISNIGALNTLAMNPLIYGETATHASVGSLRKIPMFISGKTHQRHVVDVTMGCDHRVLDGATVARFTSAWRDYSQRPTLAFLNMI